MPNSSARCAQLPRAVDKVPFYEGLRKFRDFLLGRGEEPTEEELVFSNVKLKNFNEGSPHKKLLAALSGANDHLAQDGMTSEFKVRLLLSSPDVCSTGAKVHVLSLVGLSEWRDRS